MTTRRVLAVTRIIWVDILVEMRNGIRKKVPHPAVVIFRLNQGASYVLVNGSSAPQDVAPTVTLSAQTARPCGLRGETRFYCAKEFVWFWRPDPARVPEPSGRLIYSTYQSNLRDGACTTMKAMSNLSVDIGKLPSDAGVGITIEELRELRQKIDEPDIP